MGDECNICLEKYNKCIKIDDVSYRTGNKITCTKCDYSSCTHCTKKYILDSVNDARCMNCQHPWNREFLVNNFTKVFINKEYKNHREDMLFEREKSLIPATMEILDKENMIKELQREREIFRRKMEEKLYDFDVKIWNLENSSGKRKRTNNTFIKKCCVDDCKGFLSSQWKCGLCETYTCKDCHEVIGKRVCNEDGTTELPPHTCNEDAVKTAQLLAKECKNCPKCSVPIFKIDGCDQMWCIECKTAFSWRTGEIITGHFHNPHYYEWLRQNNNGNEIPREPGDNPCHVSIRAISTYLNEVLFNNCTNLDELPQNTKQLIEQKKFYQLRCTNVIYKYKDYNIVFIFSFIEDLHRLCNHINDININEIDRSCLINDENHLFNYNLSSRKSYLKSSTTEENFKKEIQKNEKRRLKLIDRKQIYLTFTNVVNDIFRKLVSKRKMKNVISCLEEIINIINHINGQLVKHTNIYNCKVDKIHIYKVSKRFYSREYRHNQSIKIPCINIDFIKPYVVNETEATKQYTLGAFKI